MEQILFLIGYSLWISDGTLTGLKQSSDADFNARTKEQEALKAELEKAGITAGSGSFEQGDPNYRDDSLDAYTEFGVSYDKTSNHWMYDEKPIYILYDKERYTFCDKGVTDGVIGRRRIGGEPSPNHKLLVMGIIAELCISLSLVFVNSFVIALVICLLCNRKTTYQ